MTMINEKETIVSVRKNGDGDITDLKTSSGIVLSYEEAIQGVKDGSIQGLTIGKSKNGNPVLRGVADGDPTNNLDNLPTF